MINAKKELLQLIGDDKQIKCALIDFGYDYTYHEDDEIPEIILKVNHTPSEYADFLRKLDFDYDNGYGGQNLFGTIWFTDGTWADRGEYDGSEWWGINQLPEIPKYLH